MGKRKRKKKAVKNLIYIVLLLIIAAGTYFGIFDDPLGVAKPGKTGVVTEIKEGDLQVHMIDVGQADSFLVRIPDGKAVKNILIDAGCPNQTKSDAITDYLSACGIKELDLIILTHPHYDHIGSAKKVLESVTVRNVMIPDCDYSSAMWTNVLESLAQQSINVIFSDAGKTLDIGEAKLKILAPSDKMLSGNEANDYSIVTKLTYGDTSFMFTGDAESDSEAEILGAFSKSELKCNVLKVGHHGSRTSSSQEFLDAVNPDIALISCGKNNDYGHPHDETMKKLNAMGINIFRTDEMGSVVIVSDGKTVSRLEAK